jgi:hypothetical protein
MSALLDLQGDFFSAVMGGAEREADLLAQLEETPAVARRRLAAYRRSILGNLIGALLATYPVVAAIVGMPFFREAAGRYVRAHPSTSGDLNEYGADFADFLGAYPHAADLPYLPDVARLEWLVQTVFYAADPPPIDLSALAAAPPARHGELVFAISGACARFDSRWPLADIWRVNQEGFVGEMQVDFSRHARLLVLRRSGLVHVQALAPGDAVLFDALRAGKCLATAVEHATRAEAGHDPAVALQTFAAEGLLLGARLPIEEKP